MGLYLPKMYIGGSWFVDFADCAASLTPAADLVYRYGSATGAEEMMDFAPIWHAYRRIGHSLTPTVCFRPWSSFGPMAP